MSVKKIQDLRWLLLFLLCLGVTRTARSDEKPDSIKCPDGSAQPSKTNYAPTSAEIEKCPSETDSPAMAPAKQDNFISDYASKSRELLQTKGLEFHGFLKTEGTTDFHSGLSGDGADYRGLLETSISVDLDNAFRWKGGKVLASFHDYFGTDGTEDLIDDAQGFSNIDAQPMNRIYELWFEQTLANGKIRIKLGRIDANTEFAFVENATEFLNSSMGYSPTILDMHSYPELRNGAILALKPADSFYLTVGDFLCPNRGDMAMGEIGIRWKISNRQLPGRLAFGSWIHPHTIEGYLGQQAFGLHGYYIIGEQMLWNMNRREADTGRGIRAFAQWGTADPLFNGISRHLGGGAEWIGVFPHRPADVVGLGITDVHLGPDYFQAPIEGHERSIESFYKLTVRSWMSFTADLQIIRDSSNALNQTQPYVGTLRMVLSY
jgi:porin